MASRSQRVSRIAPSGETHALERAIAIEAPVAIEINGLGYAVMMMTPQDLEDFAVGFCLSERLITQPGLIDFVEPASTENGIVLRIGLDKSCSADLEARARRRVSESSCGLCGIENLEAVMQPLPPIARPVRPSPEALFSALEALQAHQPLNQQTGGVHAAAAVSSKGDIRLVREDVGRHNAFDKLIGAMARAGLSWEDGFTLLSSRCSYELVEKAVIAGCPALATVSVATSLAIDRAKQAGLPLTMLTRHDALLKVV
ncbi:MAG: formate dehydrogenase accessory sulfurtransferase FdhD [Pseudomonadota bacterium]